MEKVAEEKHSFLCPCYDVEGQPKQEVCVCYTWDLELDEISRRDIPLSYFRNPGLAEIERLYTLIRIKIELGLLVKNLESLKRAISQRSSKTPEEEKIE